MWRSSPSHSLSIPNMACETKLKLPLLFFVIRKMRKMRKIRIIISYTYTYILCTCCAHRTHALMIRQCPFMSLNTVDLPSSSSNIQSRHFAGPAPLRVGVSVSNEKMTNILHLFMIHIFLLPTILQQMLSE